MGSNFSKNNNQEGKNQEPASSQSNGLSDNICNIQPTQQQVQSDENQPKQQNVSDEFQSFDVIGSENKLSMEKMELEQIVQASSQNGAIPDQQINSESTQLL